MRQVLTDRDWAEAMLDYIADQVDGRLRLEFPEHEDVIDTMLESLRDPFIRVSEVAMKFQIARCVSSHMACLTDCILNGCQCEENHNFIKEFIHLVWDARDETTKWLLHRGIVPGQSVN